MATSGGEMITVQIGESANRACVDWWNSLAEGQQAAASSSDENGSVLFRISDRERGDGPCPRAVMLDLKANIGNLRFPTVSAGAGTDEVPNWTGAASVHRAEPDETGSGWITRVKFPTHPKSVIPLEGFPDEMAESLERGRELWTGNCGKTQDEFEDSLRFFAEECDSLEGFNIVADGSTGLVALVEPVTSLLRDDFGRGKFVANLHLHQPASLNSTNLDATLSVAIRRLNTALTLAAVAEPSSAVLPFQTPSSASLPDVGLGPLGLLETLTSPYRQRSRLSVGGPGFGAVLNYFRQRGSPIVASSAAFPGKLSKLSDLENLLKHRTGLPDIFGCARSGRYDWQMDRVFCAAAFSLGLGEVPVEDPDSWLRTALGARFDCRMEMLGKSLRLPSDWLADLGRSQTVPVWDLGAGAKGTSCLAVLFQGDAVGAFLESAADFCSKVKKNAKFLAAMSSDAPQLALEVDEASELLASFAGSYES